MALGVGLSVGLCATAGSAANLRLVNDQSTLHTTVLQLANTSSVRILWGDGAYTDTTADGSTHIYSHSYTSTSTYLVALYGGVSSVTSFSLLGTPSSISGELAAIAAAMPRLEILSIGESSITGTLSDVASLTSLERLLLQDIDVTGTLSDIASLATLTHLTLNETVITGQLSDIASLTSLEDLALYDSAVSGAGTAIPAAWSDPMVCTVASCGWDSATVDDFLAKWNAAGSSTGSINLAGTNAARTSASDDDYAALVARSWSVTVNT